MYLFTIFLFSTLGGICASERIVEQILYATPDVLLVKEIPDIPLPALCKKLGKNATPLKLAIFAQRMDWVDVLLTQGADIYTSDEYGHSIVHNILDALNPSALSLEGSSLSEATFLDSTQYSQYASRQLVSSACDRSYIPTDLLCSIVGNSKTLVSFNKKASEFLNAVLLHPAVDKEELLKDVCQGVYSSLVPLDNALHHGLLSCTTSSLKKAVTYTFTYNSRYAIWAYSPFYVTYLQIFFRTHNYAFLSWLFSQSLTEEQQQYTLLASLLAFASAHPLYTYAYKQAYLYYPYCSGDSFAPFLLCLKEYMSWLKRSSVPNLEELFHDFLVRDTGIALVYNATKDSSTLPFLYLPPAAFHSLKDKDLDTMLLHLVYHGSIAYIMDEMRVKESVKKKLSGYCTLSFAHEGDHFFTLKKRYVMYKRENLYFLSMPGSSFPNLEKLSASELLQARQDYLKRLAIAINHILYGVYTYGKNINYPVHFLDAIKECNLIANAPDASSFKSTLISIVKPFIRRMSTDIESMWSASLNDMSKRPLLLK